MKVTGTYLRKSGEKWRGVALIDDGQSTRQTTKTLSASTKRQATVELEEWAASLASSRKKRAPRPTKKTTPTVAGWASHFVKDRINEGLIEPATIRSYQSTLKWIERGFASIPIDKLTAQAVRLWESDLTIKLNLSSSTVGKAHRLLKQALSQAVDEGVIPSNPMKKVKAPARKNKKPGINTLDAKGRSRLLDFLSIAAPTPIVAATNIALYTGMRRGEVCALRWDDIDIGGRLITVCRSVGEGPGGAYLKTPKNGESRTIPIPDGLVPPLVARKGQGLGTWVVGGSSFASPTRIDRDWRTLAETLDLVGTAGRRPTFHDLRHTWATMAVAAGVDIKTVSNNLGHANAAMTLNVYTAYDPAAGRRAAQVIDSVMRG